MILVLVCQNILNVVRDGTQSYIHSMRLEQSNDVATTLSLHHSATYMKDRDDQEVQLHHTTRKLIQLEADSVSLAGRKFDFSASHLKRSLLIT